MIRQLKPKSLSLAVMIASGIAAPTALSEVVLEEVVVTAQKREQSLQDTPIALTAFDSKALENYGIKNVADVGLFTPNVNIAKSPGGAAGATISVRGSVTVNPAITWEPTVGLYLDGVFLGKNIGGVFDIAELERVEVLRGPQGTLYGKNTVGGAINLITRKPGEEFGGKLRGTLGNYGLQEVYASIDTGAVTSGDNKLAANVSFLKTDRDGYYDNEFKDPFGGFNPLVTPVSTQEYNDADDQVGRLDLLFNNGDAFEMRYVFDYSNRDNKPSMGQLTDVNQAAFDATDPGDGSVSALGGLLSAYQEKLGERPDEVANDNAGFEKSKTYGHALTLDFDAGNWGAMGDVTLKSITALRKLDYEDAIDIDGSNMDFFHSGRDIDYKQQSQEFQLLGKTETTDYVVGLYYFKETADVINPISFFTFNMLPADRNEYGMTNNSLAAFAQADWRPIDRLTLTLGARWTEEERDQYIFHPGTSDAVTGRDTFVPRTSTDDTWNNTSFSFVAAYDLTDEINVYGKVSEGWKSGGFNGEASTQADFLESYDPEEVLSLELGLKSRLLDNRLQLNAALFQNNIEDMQFSVFSGGNAAASNVSNAGEATINGFELEAIGQVTDWMRITAAYGYLDAEYDEFINGGVDVKSTQEFQFTPENTASLAADIVVGTWDWGMVDVHIDWSYKDDQVPYTNPDQAEVTKIDAYDVVNARISLSEVKVGGDSRLSISAWGKNLTDEEYNTHGIPFGLWAVNYYGDPRTYGIDAVLEF